MRMLALGLAVSLWAGAALAQTPAAVPPAPKLFASPADIQALIQTAKARAAGGQTQVVQPLVTLPPYRANLEYRTGAGSANVHETEAEIFIVIDGAGTMVTGGRLANQTRPNPTNLQGTAIEGGEARQLAKDDVIFVPQGVAHWVSKVEGALVLISMHVPRPVPPAAK